VGMRQGHTYRNEIEGNERKRAANRIFKVIRRRGMILSEPC
jgi:hypothetical protein